jgi:hypothetical protein
LGNISRIHTLREVGAWHNAGSMNDPNIDVGLHIYDIFPSNLITVPKSSAVS